MSKKIFSFLTLAILALSSCTYVYFDKPQPINAEVVGIIPQELRGVYVDEENDTFMVVSAFTIFVPLTDTTNITFDLTASNVMLRKKGKWYVLNVRDTVKDLVVWMAYPIKVKGKNKIVYYDLTKILDSAETIQMLQEIQKIVPAKLIGDDFLVFPSSNKEFFKLVKSDLFSKEEYYKISE